jgi:hypothetical protein
MSTNRPLMGASVAKSIETVQVPGLHSGHEQTTPEPVVSPETPSHDWEKRYKDLQSYSSREMNTKSAEIAELKAGMSKFKVPKTADELAAFRTENPDTYQVIQSIAHDIANTQLESVNGELARVNAQLTTSSREQSMDTLQRQHPDFMQIDGSPEFQSWLNTQNHEVQGWILTSEDPDKVNMALSLFKQNTGWGSGQQNNSSTNVPDASGALAVDVRGGSGENSNEARMSTQYVWGETEISRLRPDEYSKYESSIMLAADEGRISSSR